MSRDVHSERRASPMRGLLLFVLGGLVGVNVTYFVMTRNAASMAIAPTATIPAEARGPLPVADGPRPATNDLPSSTQHEAGPVLPPPVASIRGTLPDPGMAATTTSPAPASNALLIPVQGVAATQLSDTFTDSRGAGRVHDAIDIMAPAGTPVLAVADGHVEKLFDSKLGGLTLYQFNHAGTLAYYYAHLQRYADGITETSMIKRGQVIGYVGATGNANPDAPHLHFAIFVLGPEKQWWKGEAVNPYPRLAGGGAAP